MVDHRLPPNARLKRQTDFDRVYERNVYAADHVLVLRVAENGLDHIRLGLSVSRRVGNAVIRNRWKRLVREAFRTQKNQLPQGIDVVVRPRRGAEPHYQAIVQSLPALVNRAVRSLARENR